MTLMTPCIQGSSFITWDGRSTWSNECGMRYEREARSSSEDADHDGWYCHPPNEGFEFFVRSFKQILDLAGGDHAFGRKLYRCFLEAGIPNPEIRLVQSARVSGEAKDMAWLTLDGIKDSIVSHGVASADEVERSLDDLRRLTDDPGSLIGAPRVFQVWAKRIQGGAS